MFARSGSRVDTKIYSMNVLRSLQVQNGKFIYKKSGKRFFGKRHGEAASLTEFHDEPTAVSAKVRTLDKLPAKPPFMKNMFQGKFDTELLAYPEFLGEHRLKLLDKNVEVVRKLVEEEIFSDEIDESRSIPDELLKKLSQLKLFGMSAPRSLGGAEFTNTERTRVFESLCQDCNIPATIFNHESCGHKLISRYGDDYQKDKYLKALVSGNMFCTPCFGEARAGSDASYFETYAIRVGPDWLLSGSKVWVMNADKADLFIVFAKVREAAQNVDQNVYYTIDSEEVIIPEDVGVFLVEKSPKIKLGPRLDTYGFRGVSFHEVTFEDVIVPECQILSTFKRGYHIVKEYLTEDRHLLACMPLGMLKTIQENVIDYSIRRKLHGSNLHNYGFIQTKISNIVVTTYVIESMLYYTTGLMDMYDGQDVEVESAIVKVFSAEAGWKAINDAILLLGGNAFLEKSPFYRYLRDMRFFSIMDSSNDVYKCLIALNGLQYISNEYADRVIRHRNPFFFPLENLKNYMNIRLMRAETDNPVLDMKLKEHLHPSLQFVADEVEYCVIRFEHGVNSVLSRVGPSSVNDQYLLKRISECAISIYAMVAVISRASRSYCIGHKNAQEELIIAETFIRDEVVKFKYSLEGVIHGEYYCTDANRKCLADKSIKSSGYFLEQPLKLNF